MAETFTADAVESWLATNLPAWRLQKTHLRRLYKTGNWRVTLMVANAIGYMAEAADHHPELILNYSSVEVHLQTHSAGGITAQDYALARRIEETVLWHPGPAEGLAVPAGKWVERE